MTGPAAAGVSCPASAGGSAAAGCTSAPSAPGSRPLAGLRIHARTAQFHQGRTQGLQRGQVELGLALQAARRPARSPRCPAGEYPVGAHPPRPGESRVSGVRTSRRSPWASKASMSWPAGVPASSVSLAPTPRRTPGSAAVGPQAPRRGAGPTAPRSAGRAVAMLWRRPSSPGKAVRRDSSGTRARWSLRLGVIPHCYSGA